MQPTYRTVNIEGIGTCEVRRMNYGELLKFATDPNAVEGCVQVNGAQLVGPKPLACRFTELESSIGQALMDEILRVVPTVPPGGEPGGTQAMPSACRWIQG